jgi:hypothetical protein
MFFANGRLLFPVCSEVQKNIVKFFDKFRQKNYKEMNEPDYMLMNWAHGLETAQAFQVFACFNNNSHSSRLGAPAGDIT